MSIRQFHGGPPGPPGQGPPRGPPGHPGGPPGDPRGAKPRPEWNRPPGLLNITIHHILYMKHLGLSCSVFPFILCYYGKILLFLQLICMIK